MEDREKQIEKSIKQAAASVRMEKLPLNQEFVDNLRRKMLMLELEGPKLTLKRCDNGTKSNKSV